MYTCALCEIKFNRSVEVFPIDWIELIQVVAILYISCWPLKNNLLIGQAPDYCQKRIRAWRQTSAHTVKQVEGSKLRLSAAEAVLVPGQSWAIVMNTQTLSCRWEKQLSSSLEEDR